MPETASYSASWPRAFARTYRSARERMLWRHTTLEPFIEKADPHAEDDEEDGPSLHERVVLRGDARPAVSVRIGAESVCSVYAPPRSTFVVHCGLTSGNPARVRFEVGAAGIRQHCEVNSGGPWTTLQVPIADQQRAEPVTITLRTTLVQGTTEDVVAFWGAPALYWRKSLTDLGTTLARAVRQYGVTGAISRLRAHGAAIVTDPDSAYRAWLEARTPKRG